LKGLDTNVLIRLLLADDPEQTARGRAFVAGRSAGEPLFVNRIVICELVWTLRRGFRFDRGQIADVVDRMLKSRALEIEDYDALGFALYLYQTGGADLADCLLGVTNGLLGCERTATFDRRAAELDEFELI
jgi:predicted nucleic-acid-binding protein